MKNILFVALVCLFYFKVDGQINSSSLHNAPLEYAPQLRFDHRIPSTDNRESQTGFDWDSIEMDIESFSDFSLMPFDGGVVECAEIQVIGRTLYDLQSNASIDDRMAGGADAVSAGWTMSLELTPFDDRGTGYNFHDGSVWNEIPDERIETTRTGWPSIVHTANGREVVMSHAGVDTPLHMAWRDAGSGAWSETSIESDLEVGKLWPRMAAGGEDGNSLHVICISTPEANGGAVLNGQDGALLYYRSQDGGDTWDITDMIFSELDSSAFFAFSGDTYAIHARGNTVAFAAFNDFADSFVMISQDNGDTWEQQLLVDFPVDLYEVDMGLPEIGEDYNEDGLFQEFFNADGAGDVHVDTYGQVHVSYGSMYYMDADTIDGTTSYFPGTNGLAYWNETMGPNSAQIVAYSYDIDGDGILDLDDNIAVYGVGCAAFPSMASDASGNMYITYSAIMENFSTGVQNYRHQYVIHSMDGGMTWNTEEAYDLTPDVNFDGYEAVFGSIAPDVVNGTLEIIYQRDLEPGLHVSGDLDPIDINDIVHLRVPIELLDSPDVCWSACTDPSACNFDPVAVDDDGSCLYGCGCMDESACNYDDTAEFDDGSCCVCGDLTSDVGLDDLVGMWQFSSIAGAISVGPSPLSGEWFSSPENGLDVSQYDDVWSFYPNGEFHYSNGGSTIIPSLGYAEQAVSFEPTSFVVLENGPFFGGQTLDIGDLVSFELGITCGWFGVMDSGSEYEIVELNDSTLIVVSEMQTEQCQSGEGFFTLTFEKVGMLSGICIAGCVEEEACNYDPDVIVIDNEACVYPGCEDPSASNYDSTAGCPAECLYVEFICADVGDEGWNLLESGTYPEWQEAVLGIAWSGEWVLNIGAEMEEPSTGVVYPLHHFEWTDLSGIPEWAEEVTFELGSVGPNEQRCISASGISALPGMHEIQVTGELFISLFGQPFSVGFQSYSAWLEVLENPNPIPGCTYVNAVNYLAYANIDDGTCSYPGCMDSTAGNYNPYVTRRRWQFVGDMCNDDESSCTTDVNSDGFVNVSDLLILLSEFGISCE